MRRPLALDPARPIAIKRSVHEITLDAQADRVAAALTDVLTTETRFGPIQIRREGDRFSGFPAWAERLPRKIVDAFLSDHCELVELGPRRARYRYLEGTPLAGESTLEVLGDAQATIRQTFVYQERNALALLVIQRLGVRWHDEAFAAQAAMTAARVGARITSSTLLR